MTQDSLLHERPQDGVISHLVELRLRLLRALSAIGIACLVLLLYPGAPALYDLLARPMLACLPAGSHMIATGVVTPFIVPMKVTLMAAFILALPVVLWQAWAFIAPGLYKHEKHFVLPLILSTTCFFLAGIAFCYFVVFGMIFKMIAAHAPLSILPAPDIETYLSFVITMFLAFGLAFEVPVAVVLLVTTGIISIQKLQAIRGYIIVGAFVIAAIVTPPDILSQFMLAIPLCLFFELGLGCARLLARRTLSYPEKKPYL